MSWTRYRKTAPIEAVLIEELDDIPHDVAALAEVYFEDGDDIPSGYVHVKTAEGWVLAEPPFYLCRAPGATDHAWPLQPEHLEAWYEANGTVSYEPTEA